MGVKVPVQRDHDDLEADVLEILIELRDDNNWIEKFKHMAV